MRGVGRRHFSERLPNVRIATDDGRLPICGSCPAWFRRNPLKSCDECGVPWGVPGRAMRNCDLPGVPETEICVRAGTPLWPRRSVGNRYMALLRGKKAGKLTIAASCC